MTDLQLIPASSALVFRADAGIAREALVFLLDGQEYGIALNCVQEIRSFQAPTRLAGASEYVLGVIDLRGEVVPLIDLRLRLGLLAAEANAVTVTIVVTLGDRRVGIVADQVNDVVELAPGQIRAMPAMKGGPEQRHLVAIGSLEARTIVLMDVEALLSETTAAAPLALAA